MRCNKKNKATLYELIFANYKDQEQTALQEWEEQSNSGSGEIIQRITNLAEDSFTSQHLHCEHCLLLQLQGTQCPMPSSGLYKGTCVRAHTQLKT